MQTLVRIRMEYLWLTCHGLCKLLSISESGHAESSRRFNCGSPISLEREAQSKMQEQTGGCSVPYANHTSLLLGRLLRGSRWLLGGSLACSRCLTILRSTVLLGVALLGRIDPSPPAAAAAAAADPAEDAACDPQGQAQEEEEGLQEDIEHKGHVDSEEDHVPQGLGDQAFEGRKRSLELLHDPDSGLVRRLVGPAGILDEQPLHLHSRSLRLGHGLLCLRWDRAHGLQDLLPHVVKLIPQDLHRHLRQELVDAGFLPGEGVSFGQQIIGGIEDICGDHRLRSLSCPKRAQQQKCRTPEHSCVVGLATTALRLLESRRLK